MNLYILRRLEQAGIKMKTDHKSLNNTPLNDMRFVFTGTLSFFTRTSAQQRVEDLGGKVFSAVSKNIDYVVIGDKPGSKYEKAKKLGVKIIDEEEFKKIVKIIEK